MNIKETELRKKLDLVIEKLLNLEGPDNEKELQMEAKQSDFSNETLESVSGTGRRVLDCTDC